MEKSERAIMAVTSSPTKTCSDFEPRKLVRQLDFAPVFRTPVQSLSRVAATQVETVADTVELSAVVKPESPKTEPPASLEVKDRTPKKQKQCNCKNSRCLKLYCECFASGIYCDGCNCLNCHNNAEHENARKEAVEATLERNPNAFRPKIANSPHGSLGVKQEMGPTQVVVKHNKGCNCKRSGCLKKYCECFQANVLCSDNCKCVACKNFEGSKERRALFHGSHENFMVYQAANAAINGAIGSSGFGNSPTSRKRRRQEMSYVSMYHKQPVYHNVQYKQGNQLRCSTSSISPEPTFRGVNAQAVSKVTYRSPLAGVIQPQDVRELCSLLVMVSKEATKTLAVSGKDNSEENQGENGESNISHDDTSLKLDAVREADTEKCISKIDSTNDQSVGTSAESSVLDDIDLQYERPASPGTLALMCYEQGTVFMEDGSSVELTNDNQNAAESSSEQFITEAFAEQEQMVLTKFRDFLNRLITCGSIKETMCSSLANKDRHVGNGVKSVVPVTNHVASKVAGVAFGPSSGFTQSIDHPIQNGLLKPMLEKAI